MRYKILLLALFFITQATFAQKIALRTKISSIAQAARGKVGVAFSVLEDRETYFVNGHGCMVMQGAAKLPIAITVLRHIDEGKLSLSQKVHITKEDLFESYSPLRLRYPEGNVDVSVADLLNYTVALNDNDASDILLKTVGGIQQVEAYIRQLGIQRMEIKATEQQIATSWLAQYNNWCEPVEMVKLLSTIYSGTALSKDSNELLVKMMMGTDLALNRIKGMLPREVVVAHRPGSGPTNSFGMTPATNDSGIIMLPNGKHLALAVFITDGVTNDRTRDQVIAQISKVIYDDATAMDNNTLAVN